MGQDVAHHAQAIVKVNVPVNVRQVAIEGIAVAVVRVDARAVVREHVFKHVQAHVIIRVETLVPVHVKHTAV